MGIHGEPGIRRGKLKSANEVTDELFEKLISDGEFSKGDKISILVNSLGATPHEELFIVTNRLKNNFDSKNIDITKTYVGRYATSMEMSGLSITVLKLDEELEKHLLSSVENPFW